MSRIMQDDLISRQAAIDAMAELQGKAATKAELKGISKAWKKIKNLPPAQDAVPVMHGHWIETGESDDAGNKYYSCSCCHAGENHHPKVMVPYCWKCGAKMDEVTE